MGLDMYLYRKRKPTVGKVKPKVVRKGDAAAPSEVGQEEPKEEIGYWRKANQIHAWFVDNVQGGKDDCEEYGVSRSQLGQLLAAVKEVLDNSKLVPGNVSVGQSWEGDGWKDTIVNGQVVEDPTVAKELLPTREGFFFGYYHYDEHYIADLRQTEKILRLALDSPLDTMFTYQSSW
jgi:hypothetical protein